jgi:hypothetical protein
MRKMKGCIIACAVLLMLAATPSVFAATDTTGTLTGTWTGEIRAADGATFHVTFLFKQDGSTLTGTDIDPQGDPLPIENGKVSGDNFSFTVSMFDMTVQHSGTLNGDTITLNTKSAQSQFPGKPITLKRSK